MGNTLFEKVKKQLNDEMEMVQNKAKDCHPEIKEFFRKISIEGNTNFDSFNMSMRYLETMFGDESEMQALEDEQTYRDMKVYLNALKYIVGLTDDAGDLEKCKNGEGTFQFFAIPLSKEEIDQYRAYTTEIKQPEEAVHNTVETAVQQKEENVYGKIWKQMLEEMEHIQKAAENCSPDIKGYIKKVTSNGNWNFDNYNYIMNSYEQYSKMPAYNDLSLKDVETIETTYEPLKIYVNALKRMVGLTDDAKDLRKCINASKDDVFNFSDMRPFTLEKLKPYWGKNIVEKSYEQTKFGKRVNEVNASMERVWNQMEDCNPKIREVMLSVLDPEKGEYAAAQKTIEKLQNEYAETEGKEKKQAWKDKKLFENQNFNHAMQVIETVKYLMGFPVNDTLVLDEIAGVKVEDLEEYRQIEVDRNKRIDAEKENRRILHNTLNHKKPSNPDMEVRGKEKSFISGNPVLGVRFPAVNPKGIYCPKQAELRERLARIHQVSQLRPKGIRNLISEFEKCPAFKKEGRKMNRAYEELYRDLAKNTGDQRDFTQQEFKVITEEMDKAYKGALKELDEKVKQEGYEQIIEAMEYLAGISPELNENTRAKLEKYAIPVKDKNGKEKTMAPKLPEKDSELEKDRKKVLKPWDIGKLDVKFEDMDSMLTNLQMAVPKYKGMSEQALENIKVTDAAANKCLNSCFVATVKRLTDPLYREFEKNNPSLDRSDLIIIEGKSIKKHLEDKMGSERVRTMDSEEKQKITDYLVAVHLQDGKHVEAFVPQEDGRISSSPVSVEMSGCQAKKLKKINDGLIMQLIYKISDFFGWTNRRKEKELYESTLASREQIRAALNEKGILDTTKAPAAYESELMGEERPKEAQHQEITNENSEEIKMM